MPNQYNYEQYKLYRDIKKVFVLEYLLTHPCVDCGETDIRVLDFDHVDPALKKGNVASISQSGNCSLKTLIAEIAKCMVRCSNCHRKKTIGIPLWFADFPTFKADTEQRNEARMANIQSRKAVHGKRRMYHNGCRCNLCRAAQNEYQKEWSKRKKLQHQDSSSTS